MTPALVGALIAIVSASIFIKYLNTEVYANFIIQHIVITFGTSVLSFYIGKVTMISIKDFDINQKRVIIFNSLVIIIFTGLILSFITHLLIFFYISKLKIFEITLTLFFGILFSCIYLNLEDLAKGLSMNKSASLSNFFFMNGSISIPGFLLLLESNELIKQNLFNISVLIKIIVAILLIFLICKNNKIQINKINMMFFFKNLKQNLYLCGVGFVSQIYYALDKYIIKSQFNPIDLIIFSLSQQISSKLGILSNACQSVMFSRLLNKTSIKRDILSANLYFCLYLCAVGMFILNPFIHDLLSLFFNDKYEPRIDLIFKLFILINIICVIKDCLSSFLQITLKTRYELKFNLIFLPMFLVGLFFGYDYKNILIFMIIILLKEFYLVIAKIILIKDEIINYKKFLIQISILSAVILLDCFDLYDLTKYTLIVIFIILSIRNLNYKLIKNYLFKKINENY